MAAAFYAKASAGKKRLPEEVLKRANATKDRLAKKMFGPDGTSTEYQREARKELVKRMLGPDGTSTKYNLAGQTKLAKKKLRDDNATAADYKHITSTEQAIRELGPTATAADLRKLQREERALAALRGVPVQEVRRERRPR